MSDKTLYNQKFCTNSNDFKSSFGGTKIKKKNSILDIKERYWVYLFQNLKLAVNEIYQTCETDESIPECDKAINILQSFSYQFNSLRQKLQLSKELLEISSKSKINNNNNNSMLWQQAQSNVSEMSDLFLQTVSLQKQIGKVDQILAMKNLNPYYEMNEDKNDETLYSVYTSNASSPDNYNRLSDVSSVISNIENKYDENFLKSQLFRECDSNLIRDWDAELNHSRSTDYYKIDNSDADAEEENSEYTEEKDYYSLFNSIEGHDMCRLNQTPLGNSIKQTDLLSHDDTIDELMLNVYEHEENLALILEKEQDEELRSVIEQEVKLKKQLSVEQLKHYGRENYNIVGIEKHRSKSAMNKTLSYKGYLNKLQHQMDHSQLSKSFDNQLENELGFIRAPSRAMQIHERILKTSRKASPTEHRRRHEEKQARAQEKRERFYEDRAQKLRELTVKISEVRKIKLDLLRAKKLTMKAKLQRAEEKRVYLLQLKAKKAADEELKAHEILFINNLKEQNRRQDILERYEKRNELRRQNLEEERIRKQEELKTKEHAAEVRRKEIETQRVAKLKEMQEKRRIKQSQIEKVLLKKEKERLEVARAKEKTREQRLAALDAQFKAKKEEEKKRILQKQEEWSKRHESNLEEIRKKAFEMSILHGPCEDQNLEISSNVSYEKEKFCKICSISISTSENQSSHFKCARHQQFLSEANQGKTLTKSEIDEFNMKCIVYISDDKQINKPFILNDKKQTTKKRLKKIKNKIITKGSEYETCLKSSLKTSSSPVFDSNGGNKVKLTKLLKDLSKTIEIVEKGGNSNEISTIDKHCREIVRMIEKDSLNQNLFFELNGLSISTNLLNSMGKSHEIIRNSTKSISLLLDLLTSACKDNFQICRNLVLTNKIVTVIEVLHANLNIVLPGNLVEGNNKPFNDSCVPNLIQMVSALFLCLSENENVCQKSFELNNINFDVSSRIIDIIAFIVNLGVLNKFSIYLSNIRNFDDDKRTVSTVMNCLNILTTITKFVCIKKSICFEEQKNEDLTQLAAVYKTTSVVGIISMLYGLLHNESASYYKNEVGIKHLPSNVLQIILMGFRMLNQTAVLDLNMLQTLLSEESLSLQLRHITSFLLWYCTQTNTNDLLNEVILLIGYFTVLNVENQVKIELGTPPTVLQLLCTLPFSYFSDPKLSDILLPTLISCSYKNEKNSSVLSDEVSTILLANYIEENMNKVINSEKSDNSRFELGKRFPEKLWSDALQYFSE